MAKKGKKSKQRKQLAKKLVKKAKKEAKKELKKEEKNPVERPGALHTSAVPHEGRAGASLRVCLMSALPRKQTFLRAAI
jgi:hypothetical protein